MTDYTTIDLHGVRHGEVQSLLDSFLWRNLAGGSAATLTVITGNSDSMKAEVRRVLADYGLTGEEGIWNKGQLLVSLLG